MNAKKCYNNSIFDNYRYYIKKNINNYFFFAIANSLIFLVLSIGYLPNTLRIPSSIADFVYLITMHTAYISLLVIVCSIILLPLVLLPKWLLRITLAIISGMLITALLLDMILYADFSMHLNMFPLDVAILKITSYRQLEYIIIIAVTLLLILTEYWLFSYVQKNKNFIRYNKYYLVTCCSCMLIAIAMFRLTNDDTKIKYTSLASHCAFFSPTKYIMPMKKIPDNIANNIPLKKMLLPHAYLSSNGYSTKKIQYNDNTNCKDIVFILIDAWRADKISEELTPNICKYADQGVRFDNHIASANYTKGSVFGMFYSMPVIYHELTLASKKLPVLFSRLQQLDYQINILFSAKIEDVGLEKTVFRSIKNLRLASKAETPARCDIEITEEWLNWYANSDNTKPRFSFLFYDSVHAYDFTEDFNQQYAPLKGVERYNVIAEELGMLNMAKIYEISVSYVDQLVGKILDKIQDSGQLKNTIIIITGDHGHELNDNRQNVWGHGSNLTNFQVKVPMIIIADEFNQKFTKSVDNITSHYDLVPTIARNYLGISNAADNFSMGIDLLTDDLNQRSWVPVAGRNKYMLYFGITDNKNNAKIMPAGFYQLLDNSNNIVTDEKIQNEYLQYIYQAFSMARKYIY